jgi:hypothetical protein
VVSGLWLVGYKVRLACIDSRQIYVLSDIASESFSSESLCENTTRTSNVCPEYGYRLENGPSGKNRRDSGD